MNPQVLTVRAHEVNKGDLLVGLTRPVDMVLYHGGDGRWLYTDAAGTILRAVHSLAYVQVIRGLPVDECDPHGIDRPQRHLEVVR